MKKLTAALIKICLFVLVLTGCKKESSFSGLTDDAAASATPPTTLVVGTVTASSVELSWTDSANETSYIVERCTGASCTSFSTLAASPLAADTTTFTDGTVSDGTVYRYRLAASNTNGSSIYLTSSDITTLTASNTATCTSPNHTIIDYGTKGNLAAVARGVYSDVKYIPASNSSGIITLSANAGVAYYDVGALAIKYSYWNGSTFTTETVAGDSAANVTQIRIAYLSTGSDLGKPLIFWTNGAVNSGQIMMASRDTASLTAAGTWTVSAIDSAGGAATRALEVSVSPIDQVALGYQATTIPAANAVRFIYCSSGCTSYLNYNSMSSAAQVNTTAAVANQLKIGTQWCQVSTGVYNPVLSYGSTTNARVAICQTGTNTLTGCSVAGGWTENIFTGTPNTVVATDLYIDSQIVSDPIKGIAKDATNIKMYKGAAGCGAAPANITANTGVALGTSVANTASSFYEILKHPDYVTPANERYTLILNDGTTTVKQFNSTSSDFTANWNTQGTIQTVTLGAAGANRGGADLNPVTGQIASVYGTAAATFNVMLGIIDNYTIASSTAQVYFAVPADMSGHIQMNATFQNNLAMAVTSSNRPAVAYIDFSLGATTTGRLKYAVRNSSSFSGSNWLISTLPGVSATFSPQFPSIAFDHNNRPWIGYYEANTLRFILATNSSTDGTGVWTSYTFPIAAGTHGAVGAQPMANTTAVAMSYSGGVATPVLIITDNGTTKQISSARLNPSTGVWSNLTQVTTTGVSGASFLSADYSTTANMIVIAYNDLTTTRVKYSQSSDGGVTWLAAANVSAAGTSVGVGTRIRLNPVTGRPAITYYDRVNSRVFYATCANAPASCGSGWTGTVSSALNGIGISGSTTTTDNLLHTGLTFSEDGVAYINYVSGVLDTGSIRMIDNSTGTMPSALPTTVVPGVNGILSNAAAINGGIPWGVQSERFPNGVLGLAYIAPGNALGITTCGD